MSNTELSTIVRDLKELRDLQTELTAEITDLELQLKAYMGEAGVTSLQTDDAKVTWTEVTTSRFDSTAFKRDYADIADLYTVTTTTKRFTIK